MAYYEDGFDFLNISLGHQVASCQKFHSKNFVNIHLLSHATWYSHTQFCNQPNLATPAFSILNWSQI
jgi:hypothetical protein